MPGKLRVYWDSCVFLHYIEGTPQHLPILDQILKRAQPSGDIELVTSTLSISEVAFAEPERTRRMLDPEVIKALDALWNDQSVINLVDVSILVTTEARDIVRRSIEVKPIVPIMKPPDAIHLATAKRMHVYEFHTYDDKVLKHSHIHGFPIVAPYDPKPMLPFLEITP